MGLKPPTVLCPGPPPYPDAYSVTPQSDGFLLSPSTVEDIQSLICRWLGSTNSQAEDGSASTGLCQRTETFGCYNSASGPGKSEWCFLPQGLGLLGPSGRSVAAGGSVSSDVPWHTSLAKPGICFLASLLLLPVDVFKLSVVRVRGPFACCWSCFDHTQTCAY